MSLCSRKIIPSLILASGLILLGIASLIYITQNRTAKSEEVSQPDLDCVQPARVEFPAPPISLTDLSLSEVHLDDYRGDIVLLNTWATWCPPCIAEMPALLNYFESYHDKGFTLIGVNIGETRAQVLEFGLENQLTFPLWLDPTESSLRALNTIALPYSIVIDRTGMVRYAWSGATCLDALETTITPLLVQ